MSTLYLQNISSLNSPIENYTFNFITVSKVLKVSFRRDGKSKKGYIIDGMESRNV